MAYPSHNYGVPYPHNLEAHTLTEREFRYIQDVAPDSLIVLFTERGFSSLAAIAGFEWQEWAKFILIEFKENGGSSV